MPPIPAQLGKYQVLSKIAKGGMAEVYRAKAQGIAGFERILAVKRILPKLAQNPRFIRSFVDEARIAVSLNHRNIVQVVDFGKAGGELFLAMELIDGVDLRKAVREGLANGEKIPLAIALYVLADVAAGLEYAHRKTDAAGNSLGIVHCDISPQNIMLSIDGFVKILDFGVARAGFIGAPDERRLRGKPRYMAPEQTRGDPPTPATDVFALGIVAWEVLTSMRLFDGEDLHSILRAVRSDVSPRVDELNPEVPVAVADAIAKALEKAPEDRGTAGDLATIFGLAAREATDAVMSQELKAWLLRLFPRPDMEHTETGLARVPRASASSDLDDDTEVESVHSVQATATGLHEERRVVVVAAHIDGGSSASRADLRRSLGALAFKRGAVPEDREDVTAIFGLEVVGEDDVASAMHYALDALELARETGAERGEPLELRIGALAGVAAHRERDSYRLSGNAPAEASALARSAKPDHPLLAGGRGRRATTRFEFREVSSHVTLEPVLELVGPTDFSARARALHDRRGLFFGRGREISELETALEQCENGPALVCAGVVGESGVGKSRLIAEFVASALASRRSLPSVAVAATPEGLDAPFSLVGDVLQAALGLLPGRGEAARSDLAQRLRHALSGAALSKADIDDAVDTIDRAMAMRDGARLSEVSPPAHLLERVTALLRRLRGLSTSNAPRLLILEDLHYADPASREVLAAALAEPRSAGADFVVLTTRQAGDLPPGRVDIVVELEELDRSLAEALLKDRLGRESTDTELALVLDRTGGNPLYIEELAKDPQLAQGSTPGSVRDVISARVSRVSSAARAVLQYASVLGPTFRIRLVDELVRIDAPGTITELCDAGLIDVADGQGGTADYRFRHALIRDVVYDSLTAEARVGAHAKVGRLLASRYAAGRDEPPALIAKHLALGGQHRDAADYWRRAGASALEASFASSAQQCFSQAVEHYQAANADGTDVYPCRVGLVRACLLLGEHDIAATELGELDAIADSDGQRAEVSRLAAQRAIRVGDYSAASDAANRAEALSAQASDDLGVAEACRVRAEAFERLGDYQRAADDAQRAHDQFRKAGDNQRTLEAGVGLGRIYLMQSRYREAQSAYGPVLEHLEQWSDPWLERLARNHVAVIELCLGNFESAWAAARASLAICERFGDRARAGDNHSVSGIILSEIGQFELADDCFQRALAIQDETGSKWAWADCLVYAGLNDFRRGRSEVGRIHIQDALDLARVIGARYIEANALCALTEVFLHGETVADLSRTLDAAAAAVEIGVETGLVSAEILAQSRLAQATARTGDIEQAAEESDRAVQRLTEQEFIEGSEEEIYFVDYKLKQMLGAKGAARSLELAFSALQRKLTGLTRPDWHESFRSLNTSAAILGETPPEAD